MESVQRLIVGVDPGITIGLAILNLDGKILEITSFRCKDEKDLRSKILEHGKPIILACDVPSVPKKVKKLASEFKALLFSPEDEIPSFKKKKIVSEFTGMIMKNQHENDALAAAILAYKHYRTILEEAGRKADENNVARDVVREYVLKEGMPISDAISKAKGEDEEKDEKVEKGKVRESRETILSLRRKVEELERTKDLLESYISSLEEELKNCKLYIRKLEEKIKSKKPTVLHKIYDDSEIKRELENERKLRMEVEEEKDALIEVLNNVVSGKAKPVKILENLSRKEIKKLSDMYGIVKGDIIYVKDPSIVTQAALSILKKKGIACLIVEDKNATPEFVEEEIYIVLAKDVKFKKISDRLGIVDKLKLEDKLKRLKKDLERRKIEDLIEEFSVYKKERKDLMSF